MSRQRILNPAFFTDEKVCSLPPLDRLLFQGLWGEADREGRLAEKPFELKLKVLPVDNCDIPASLQRIADQGLIVRYQIDGQNFIAIRNFLKFQKPHPREAPSTIPGPEKALPSREKVVPGREKVVASPAVSVSVSVPVSVSETVSVSAPPPQKEPVEAVISWTAPLNAVETWNAVDFWAWAQSRRQAAGLVGEPRMPVDLRKWFNGAQLTLGGRTEALQEAFLRFGDSPYWQKRTPPLPFKGFMAQWTDFVPTGGTSHAS